MLNLLQYNPPSSQCRVSAKLDYINLIAIYLDQ